MTQTVFNTPDDQHEPNTEYWLVASTYADDPHPHIEEVFESETEARKKLEDCRAVTKPPHPTAWILGRIVDGEFEQVEP